MFARVTTLDIKPERIDEAIELYRKSVVPAAKKQKGFVATYFLTDRKSGKSLAVTFWKAEADALANEHNLYYQEQLVKFLDMLRTGTGPIREGFEVSVKSQ